MSCKLSPPPYADMLGLLSPHNNQPRTHRVIHSRPPVTRIHGICECFNQCLPGCVSIGLFVGFLVFSTYQLALACYNCSIPNSSFGWIRFWLFANAPFILGLVLFAAIKLFHMQVPSYEQMIGIAVAYLYIPAGHLFIEVFIITGIELNSIRRALRNETTAAFLPCPTRHYRQVLGVMIVQCVYPVLCLLLCWLLARADQSQLFSNTTIGRWKQCISGIQSRWRWWVTLVCRRHPEEFIYEQV